MTASFPPDTPVTVTSEQQHCHETPEQTGVAQAILSVDMPEMDCEKRQCQQPHNLIEKAYLSSLHVALTELGWVPRTMLDVGCQRGGLSAVLGKQFLMSQVIGVDPDQDMVDAASAEHCCKLQFRAITDESSLPFANDKFDLVISHGFLNRLDKPGAAMTWLSELMRVTAEGLIITTVSPFGHWVFNTVPGLKNTPFFGQTVVMPSYHHVETHEIISRLKRYGFKVEAVLRPFPFQMILTRKPQTKSE